MSSQSFQWLIISSLIVIIISFTVYRLIKDCQGNSYNYCQLFGRKESVDLIVLVLSARSNFDQRNVLRQSWFKGRNDIDNVTVKPFFVIGNRDCQIPYEYREDRFGCTLWIFNETEDMKTNVASHLGSLSNHQLDNQVPFNGFSFKVHHDILLKRVGCLSSCVCDYIIVKNLITQEIIYNETSKDSNQVHGYNYQDVSPILLLHKGFIGLLIATGKNDSNCQSKQINYWNEFTKLTQILRVYNDLNDFESQLFNAYDQVKTSFVVELSDPNEYQRIIKDGKKIYGNYVNQLDLIDKNLLNEVNEYHDILLVDVVDVYRNLAKKLVHGMSWIVSSHINSDLILKTDDDCFINLDKVINKTRLLTSRESIWWGNFRRNSLINVYGKWTENDFPGSVYPTFACGSGYVISMDIAKWITRNKDYLHYFQGEDVSMGIWLSSIIPTYLMDRDWACAEDHPRGGLLAYCQLNSSQLLQFYKIKSNEKHKRLLTV